MSCGRDKPNAGWGAIFNEGDIFDRNYRIHKMLAMGGAGVTYVAREIGENEEEVGLKLAIKVLLAARDQGSYVRRLSTEAQIIQELDHPHIVRYLGFVHRTGHSPYLITRFERGGCLLDHMRRVGTLSVLQTARVGQQICKALIEAHQRDIVHRDLKPENVLLEEEVELGEDALLRVADFGIAKIRGSLNSNLTRIGAFVGTPHYAAPEQFLGQPVSQACDIYSVGAMLYFCMSAQHVVSMADRMEPHNTYQAILDTIPVSVPQTAGTREEITRMDRVLTMAMDPIPARRVTATELNLMLTAMLAGHDPSAPERLTTAHGLNIPGSQTTSGHTILEDESNLDETAFFPPRDPRMEASGAFLKPSIPPSEVATRADTRNTADPAPVPPAQKTASTPEPATKKGGSLMMIFVLLLLVGGVAGAVVFMDEIKSAIGMDEKSKKSSKDDDEDDEKGSDDDEDEGDDDQADGGSEEGAEEGGSEEGAGEGGSEEGAEEGGSEDGGSGEGESEGGDEGAEDGSGEDGTAEPKVRKEQFVQAVSYSFAGKQSAFMKHAEAAARSKAKANKWTYLGRKGRPAPPNCSDGSCSGTFNARFERTVTP
jgi:serine/threonine protein kinase